MRCARWMVVGVWVLAAVVVVGVVWGEGQAWGQGGAAEGAADGEGVVLVTGRVSAVTLYRGQALVSREVELPAGVLGGAEGGGGGVREVVVTGLPFRVVGSSVFAEGGAGVSVRAVRFRSRVVSDEPREAVRELDGSIEGVKDRIAGVERAQWVLGAREKTLGRLEEGVLVRSAALAASGGGEGGGGGVDAEAVRGLVAYVFEQREAIASAKLERAVELRGLKRELGVLEARRTELTSGSQRRVNEAVVFVDVAPGVAGAAEAPRLTLGYLVTQCGWSPAYNFRAAGGGERPAEAGRPGDGVVGGVMRVEYVAMIQQLTGEDWSGVELTLSTATPSVSAAVPGLASLPVRLTPRGPEPAAAPLPEAAAEAYADLEDQRRDFARQAKQQAGGLKLNTELGWRMNAVGNRAALLEINAPADGFAVGSAIDGRRGVGMEPSEPSLSYVLPGRVSLASRADRQMMRILDERLEASFYHVAMPVLSGFVYREAELVNGTGQDLLGGPASVYLGGRYVGQTEVPTVARGQTFVVGLGADPQLRTTRELVERGEQTQGGNRVRRLDYRLAVENFSGTEQRVRLMDRLPFAADDQSVRVTLELGGGSGADGVGALSEDAVYVRTRRSEGVLRWDLSVPGGALGEDAAVVRYAYTLEYDRNFTLATTDETEQRERFERQEADRLRR